MPDYVIPTLLGVLIVFQIVILIRSTPSATLPATSTQLDATSQSRLAQLEVDFAAIKRQLGELEETVELRHKSVTQLIHRSKKTQRAQEDEELADLGRAALVAELSGDDDQPTTTQAVSNGGGGMPRVRRIRG